MFSFGCVSKACRVKLNHIRYSLNKTKVSVIGHNVYDSLMTRVNIFKIHITKDYR